MIEYKGYVGVFEFDPEIDTFHGSVVNTRDVITFYGDSVSQLKEEMKRSIDEYLAFCRERGREPEKPFSGKLSVRTSPELHRQVAVEAARRHRSMNRFVQEVLEKAVAEGAA